MHKVIPLFLALCLRAWAQTPQLPQEGTHERYAEFLSNRLLLVSDSRRLWLWDVPGRKLLAHRTDIQDLQDRAASPDGRYLVVTEYPSCARVYALPEMRQLYKFQPARPDSDSSYNIYFGSDGRSLILLGSAHGPVSPDPWVHQIDLASGREIRGYDFGQRRGHFNSLLMGKGMVMARQVANKLQLWDLKSGKKLRETVLPDDRGSLSADPDGIRYASLGHRAIYSWQDLSRLRVLPPASDQEPDQSPDGSLSWRKDDKHFQVVRNSDQKVIYQGPISHDLEHWLSLGFMVYPNQPGNRVGPVYDRDGKKIGVLPRVMLGYPGHDLMTDQPGYGGPVSVYDYPHLKLLGKLAFGTVPSYSPDGKLLAILTRTGVLLIDVKASLAAGKVVPSP